MGLGTWYLSVILQSHQPIGTSSAAARARQSKVGGGNFFPIGGKIPPSSPTPPLFGDDWPGHEIEFEKGGVVEGIFAGGVEWQTVTFQVVSHEFYTLPRKNSILSA